MAYTEDWQQNNPNYRQGATARGAGNDAYWQHSYHTDHWRQKEAHGAFDEFGFTENLPMADVGPYAQHEANRIAAQRNARLGREAGAALYGGLHNLQSYRPGGAAAMASGMYGQQAATLLSMRQAAPDLMTMWRKVESDRARKDAERAALLSAGISAVGSLAGAALGGIGGIGLGVSVNKGQQAQQAQPDATDTPTATSDGLYSDYVPFEQSPQGQFEQQSAYGAANVGAGDPQMLGSQLGGGGVPGGPGAGGQPEGPGGPGAGAGPGGPAPGGAGPGGPAPGGAGSAGGTGEAAPGSAGGNGRQMGAPMPMGGLGTQGAMGFSAPGALNSFAQITGVPQEIAYAQLYRQAGLEDGFWPALHARLNQMLGQDYIEASSWSDGGEYV